MQPAGEPARAIGRAEEPARGHPVPPARVLAARHDATPARLAVRGVDERRLVDLVAVQTYLAAKFGEPYRRYVASVRRYL